MRIWRSDLRSLRFPGPTFLTIGNFDGVHLGHQSLLRTLQTEAECHAPAARTALLTFDPHPMAVLRPDLTLCLLTTPQERLRLIEPFGLDLGIIQPFDMDFASLTSEQFMTLLVERLGLARLFVGPDFALGRGRSGNVDLLRELGTRLGYELSVIEPFAYDNGEVHSHLIRQSLLAGAVQDAAHMLGRPYQIAGIVEEGERRGRQIGVPTANIRLIPHKLVPADGVYVTWAYLPDNCSPNPRASVTNIGVRPTVDGRRRRIETHLLDYPAAGESDSLYEKELTISFVSRLRDEQRFDSLEELVAQIQMDISVARRTLTEFSAVSDSITGN
ncbi:MAG: bifunctional riboflavin kinase/FAD synthetase [Caldilineaceae bacterium]|nr:bifunctional riboflavin kinase/FAD synthetase [Caldilineaceae bacterium]